MHSMREVPLGSIPLAKWQLLTHTSIKNSMLLLKKIWDSFCLLASSSIMQRLLLNQTDKNFNHYFLRRHCFYVPVMRLYLLLLPRGPK